MSNDNFAIDIETEAAEIDEDVEANLSTSRCALMSFEEEQPVSFVASIKESVKSSKRKISYYTSYITSPIKKFLSTFKLLIIIALYSFLGAHLFMYFEVSADLAAKEETYHQRKIAREVMILNLRAIYYDNRQDYEERWKHAILRFESDLQLDEPAIETAWTFWMSFLYAGTIFTTIGYGNIACKTTSGQVATMIYAFAGIPIMLVMLNSLNNFLLKWIKIIANYMSDTILYLGIKFGVITIRQDERDKLKRYKAYIKKYKLSHGVMYTSGESGLNNAGEHVSIDMMSKEEGDAENDDDEEVQPDPPVISTIFATVAWIMLSAMIFCMFEDWSFFTSFYFCFISLTTIGLGDVTPANPEYMIATFGVVIIGLSMLTVCIDVVKEKIALMYMAILQKLLNDYMEAVKNGDPNAASAMMAGFQGKAKFLMPLMSKNDGAKVMNKFKQDCSKKGIDPPPVLTNINPETGMPAFATAQKEDFNDYIEVAEGLAAEEKSQGYMSKSSIDNLLLSRQNSTTMQVPKMNWDSRRHSMISEVAKITIDGETQTVFMDIFEIGVQANIESAKCDSSTQYQVTTCHTIGIQPEVSSIYHYNPLFSSDGSESESESDTENEYGSDSEETFSKSEESILDDDLSISKPLKIAKHQEEHLEKSSPSSQNQAPRKSEVELEKLVAEEPQVHVQVENEVLVSKAEDFQHPEFELESKEVALETRRMVSESTIIESESTKNEPESLKTSEAEVQVKKPKKKRRKNKESVTVLRFLKSSGIQTDVPTSDGSTQYDIVDKSNRRCQTKMSSISSEMVERRRRRLTLEKVKNYIIEQQEGAEKSEVVADDGYTVCEVNLDVNLISLGVDEVGHVVDIPNLLEREVSSICSISSSDDESDDLEFLFTNSSMQTEAPTTSDKESHASPASMKLISDSITQTTTSTFHRPPKIVEGTIDDVKQEEIHFMEEVGVQTRQTSFYDNVEAEKKMTAEGEDAPLFLADMETQTTSKIEVQVDTQTETLVTRETGFQTSPMKIASEDMPIIDYRDSDIQTDLLEVLDQSWQTEFNTINADIQTDLLEVLDQSWQTESIHLEATFSQTNNLETSEKSHQTNIKVEEHPVELTTISCQTIDPIPIHIPIIESIDQSNQTDLIKKEEKIENANSLCQTDIVSIYEQSIQTDVEEKHHFGLQVALGKETEDQANQTTSISVMDNEVQVWPESSSRAEQTDILELVDIDVQVTIKPDSLNSADQTEVLEYSEVEIQANIKTEDSDQCNQTELEVMDFEGQANIKMESSDQAEQTEFLIGTDFEAQVEIREVTEDQANQTNDVEVEDVEMQTENEHRESSQQTDHLFTYDAVNQAGSGLFEQSSCATQYDGGDQADKYCQADVQMKNKRVQIDDDLPSSLGELPSSDSSTHINLASLSGGPLWSDFDYMHDENEEEDVDEEPVEEVPEVAQEEKRVAPETSHALIQANPIETSSTTVQAVPETCDTSAGQIGNDDWLQVYVQELDEERRLRMSDIGIQTGVLARVQHMYTRPISDDVTSTSLTPITLRKSSDSSESPANNFEGSQESLVEEVLHVKSTPGPSTVERKSSIRRTKSLKKVRVSSALGDSRSKSEKSATSSNLVNDLRAKFEGGKKFE